MNKAMVVVFVLFPAFIHAQEIKNGSIIMDFGKKKKAQDTAKQQSPPVDTLTEVAKPKREKKEKVQNNTNSASAIADYRQGGIFKALFHAGINACQIDGDNDWGYTYLGAETGVGALARFHRFLSASLELNYSMEGARTTFASSTANTDKYMVQWDYMQAAVALNGHYRQFLIFSLGLTPE